MSDASFTTAELAKCARDEAYKRREVYPRLIEQGRMTPARAAREISMMEAIARRLEREAAMERLL